MRNDPPANRTDALPAADPARPEDAAALRARRRERLRPLSAYGAVLVLTLLVMTLTLHLWQRDLRVPLSYGGDETLHLMLTKAFLENGWYLHNPSLGAPLTMDLREFPAADTLPGLLIKAIGVFTHDPALVTNLFFLLTFPLTSLSAFFVCRRLGLSTGPALLGSLLYAFLPYHFFRGTAHLYLSAYFVVPPAVLVAWWVASGRLFDDGGVRRPARPWFAAGVCLVVSTAGVYHPFFAGIFLATASVIALCARRDWRGFLAGGALTALLAGGMLVCLSPTLWYLHTHPHPPVSQRGVFESEVYGLKIIQLVLPVDGHRLHAFKAAKRFYSQQAPLLNENTSASLGIVGTAGFLFLVGWLLFRPVAGARGMWTDARGREILDMFGVFTGVALLYGTIGGFGTLFALCVSPQVRSLNRISVFIAFFALVAVAVCLDHGARLRRYPPAARAAGWIALGLLLIVGILDQTRPMNIEDDRAVRRAFEADRAFFGRVEAAVPAGGMIFQLPYAAFPEAGPVQRMDEYSHFRGYIHTRGLRWSYGAMRDGPGDLWQQHVASLPMDAGVRQLALSGFSGLTLERDGYADDGAAAEAALRQQLGPPAATDPRRLFFNLEAYRQALRASLTPAQWEEAQDRAQHRPVAIFQGGFSSLDGQPGPPGRWCGSQGDTRLDNPSRETWHVRFRMLAHTGDVGPDHLWMSSDLGNREWTINETPQAISATLDLPPGPHVIRFGCDGKRVDPPFDSRAMVWRMDDFQLDED